MVFYATVVKWKEVFTYSYVWRKVVAVIIHYNLGNEHNNGYSNTYGNNKIKLKINEVKTKWKWTGKLLI